LWLNPGQLIRVVPGLPVRANGVDMFPQRLPGRR